MNLFLPFFLAVIPLVIFRWSDDPFLITKLCWIFAGTVALILGLLFRYARENKKILRRPSPFYLPLGLFLLVKMISLVRAVNVHAGVASLLFFVLFIVFFIAVYHTMDFGDETEIYRLVRWICWAGVIVGVYGIVQNYGFDFFSWDIKNSPLATLGRRNFTAEYLATVIPYVALLFVASRQRGGRFLYAALGVLLLFVLFLTFTRASWLGLAVAAIYVLFVSGRLKVTRKVFAAAVFIVLLLAPAGISRPAVFRFEETSVRSRLLIWKTALVMFAKNPVLGVGAGNFEIVYPEYARGIDDSVRPLDARVTRVHNEYLEAAVETGILGLAAFLFLLFVMGRVSWQVIRHGDPGQSRAALFISASLLAVLVNSFAAFPLRNPSVTAYFFLNLAFLSGLYESIPLTHTLSRQGRGKNFKNPLPGGERAGVRVIAVVLILSSIIALYIPLRVNYCLYTSKVGMRRVTETMDPVYWSLAEKYGSEAVLLNPFSVEAHYQLGSVFLAGAYPNYARDEFAAAYRLQPNSDIISNNLGIAYQRLHDLPNAEKYYLRSLDLAPARCETLNNLGAVYLQQGRVEEAKAMFRKALALNPGFTEARLNLEMAESRQLSGK